MQINRLTVAGVNAQSTGAGLVDVDVKTVTNTTGNSVTGNSTGGGNVDVKNTGVVSTGGGGYGIGAFSSGGNGTVNVDSDADVTGATFGITASTVGRFEPLVAFTAMASEEATTPSEWAMTSMPRPALDCA